MSAPTHVRQTRPVSFTNVSIDDPFWSPRLEINRTRTLYHVYQMCKQTGRIDAFLLDWKPGKEPKPHYFWDSDVAKWVEAASYSLATHPDPELKQKLDEVVAKIAGAQQPDGYLNIYFTVVEPEKRWANLGMWHELYCAGHLFEAAVAHYQATGERTLLDCALRYADYIDSVFGPQPGKREGCPGHQEIELALVKLYRVTGERRYLHLSRFFLDQRGQKPSFFVKEMERLSPEDAALNRHFFQRGDTYDTQYVQDHLPVREQSDVVGHAVRATYMICGMVDVGLELGDKALIDAAYRLWESACQRRMYITGGIGSHRANEGFTCDYDLPNETAYAETCAAIGLVFWNHRMLHVQPDGRFADVMERALYNGVISGVSLDGERFFYENPLESRGDHHRQDWFGCSCCPPNIARLLASLGGYIYSEALDAIFVHLYIGGSARFRLGATGVTLRQESRYPWDGRIRLTLEPDRQASFDLALRIPGWCRSYRVTVNGQDASGVGSIDKGYLYLRRHWRRGDVVELELDMPVERVYAHPAVRQTAGCVALQRGPVVYCLEGVDNPFPLHQVALPSESRLEATFEPDLLGGVVTLRGEALLDEESGGDLYRTTPPARRPVRIKAVPYATWDNREPGPMRVWIREAR